MMKLEASQRQPILAVCLALIGIGNITIPNTIPVLSSSYLFLALAIAALLALHRSIFIFSQLRFSVIIIFTLLTFLPGFLNQPLGEYGRTKLLAVGIAFFLIVAPSAFRNVDQNIRLIFLILFIISLVTVLCFFLFSELSSTGRVVLPGLNPIGTARACGLAVVLLITGAMLGRFTSKWQMVILFILLGPSVLATFSTSSRGPVLAAAISVVLIIVFWNPVSQSRQRLRWSFLFIGILAVVAFLLMDENSSRLQSTDSSGRDGLFLVAWDAIKENPAGIGWGNYGTLFSVGWDKDAINYPHNIFLEIAVEGGWLACLCFLIIFLIAFGNVFRGSRGGNQAAALVFSLLVFTIVNASLSSDIVGNRLLWLAIGLALLDYSKTEPSECMVDASEVKSQQYSEKAGK